MLPDPETPICSAKGCRDAAVWVLAWNNPKIHPPERRKTWLACEDHREHLGRFLGVRGLLRETVTLRQWQSEREASAPSPRPREPEATASTREPEGPDGAAEGSASDR